MATSRSFVDRYFARRYAVDVMNKPMEDLCLLAHSNGVCVLTLAPSHPVVRSAESGINVKSVDYKITGKVDRLDNKVSGKSKRGAQNLAPDSPVCRIICSGDNGDVVYTIRACAKGRLVEVNERLIQEPQLLVTHPETLGYICVIVQKRSWQQRDPQPEVEQEAPEPNQSTRTNAISLIDRMAYLSLRYPNSSESGNDGFPCVQGSMTENVDDA